MKTLADVLDEQKLERRKRLEDFLWQRFKKKFNLQKKQINPSRLKKNTEWIPVPQKIKNRPSGLGRENSYEKQSQDFIVPETLINNILNKKHLSKGTFVSTFKDNPTHKFYSKAFTEHGVKELIGIGTSNFSGSSRGRKTNIDASIKKFDNIIIPKDSIFSFNDILESVLIKDGFVYEKVIWNGINKYQLGGGVCQVSSTVYRAAFNAGLPIVERRNHSLKVGYYWPHGFDATIYLGGQDLKFKNDTQGDIMLQFYLKGNDMIVLLYGTKDRMVDTTSHGGWDYSFWWKRLINKDGISKEETVRSYYRKPITIVEKVINEEVTNKKN
jgi:hypothetical protein